MLALEIANLAITVLGVLLPQLNRYVDSIRKEPSAKEALLELQRIVFYWAIAAEDLNRVYEIWLRNPASPPTFDDFDSVDSQMAYVKMFDHLVGGLDEDRVDPRIRIKQSAGALDALFIYAPDLKASLQLIADERRYQLLDIMNDYSRNVASLKPGELAATAVRLRGLAEDLRQFIKRHFPAHEL